MLFPHVLSHAPSSLVKLNCSACSALVIDFPHLVVHVLSCAIKMRISSFFSFSSFFFLFEKGVHYGALADL